MRALLTIAFLALVFLAAGTARAEQSSPYKGGLNYTVRKQPLAPPAQTRPSLPVAGNQNLIHYKNLTPAPETPGAEDETPASRVWKKYKSLASGTYEEEKPQSAAEEKPGTPDSEAPAMGQAPAAEQSAQPSPAQTVQAQVSPTPAKATGMAAILDEYQKSKEGRSQMHVIRVQQPETHTLRAQPENKPE